MRVTWLPAVYMALTWPGFSVSWNTHADPICPWIDTGDPHTSHDSHMTRHMTGHMITCSIHGLDLTRVQCIMEHTHWPYLPMDWYRRPPHVTWHRHMIVTWLPAVYMALTWPGFSVSWNTHTDPICLWIDTGHMIVTWHITWLPAVYMALTWPGFSVSWNTHTDPICPWIDIGDPHMSHDSHMITCGVHGLDLARVQCIMEHTHWPYLPVDWYRWPPNVVLRPHGNGGELRITGSRLAEQEFEWRSWLALWSCLNTGVH